MWLARGSKVSYVRGFIAPAGDTFADHRESTDLAGERQVGIRTVNCHPVMSNHITGRSGTATSRVKSSDQIVTTFDVLRQM